MIGNRFVIVLMIMLMFCGMVTTGNAETNRVDVLLKGYSTLDAKMWPMVKLFRKCYSAKIPTDYETADFEIIRRFLDHGRSDIALGKLERADYVLNFINNLYDRNENNLNAYLAGTKQPLTVTRYRTGNIKINGYSFIADTFDPVSRKSGRRDLFFVGYGHFEQVRRDVPLFQKLGCNIIQIETGPNRGIINPPVKKGEEFHVETRTVEDDIVQVLRNAEVNNVAVCLLLSPHYFPNWIKDKYPELKNNNGFLKYNINNPIAKKVMEAYLRAVIPLVKNYKSLQSFCISNEPNFHNPGGKAYKALWKKYLKRLYHNDIAKLNKTWQTDFSSFDNVPVANKKQKDNPAMYYDWVIFNSEQFADWHKWMADIIHSMAPDIPVHAKMRLHTTFSDGDTLLTHQGVDPELFAAFTQINGCDCSAYYKKDKEMLPDYLNEMAVYDLASSLHHAPVFNSEDHIINDDDKNDYNSLRANHVRNILWQGAIHRRSASTIWLWERGSYELFQYRPDCVAAVSRTALDLNRLHAEVTAFQNAKPQVAILYSNPALVYSLDKYKDALKKTYRALSLSGINVGFITEKQIAAGDAGKYNIIFIPQTESIYAETIKKLSGYTASGRQIVMVTSDIDNTIAADEHKLPFAPFIKQAREKVLAAAKVFSPTDYTELKGRIYNLLKTRGMITTLLVDADTGKPVEGIEWRTVEYKGRTLVNIANYTKLPHKVEIVSNGKQIKQIKNLMNNKMMDSDIVTIPALSPMLVECIKEK